MAVTQGLTAVVVTCTRCMQNQTGKNSSMDQGCTPGAPLLAEESLVVTGCLGRKSLFSCGMAAQKLMSLDVPTPMCIWGGAN